MSTQCDTADRRIAALARRSHGIAARADLLGAGVTESQIHTRLQRGSLIRVHLGVYRVGHAAPSVEANYLAAVKACGEGSVICGAAAAHLLGLIRGPAPPPEVLTPTRRRVAGVVTRHTRSLIAQDAATVRGIPVTTVPRTLVDLAAVMRAEELTLACHNAWTRYRTEPADVEKVLARRPNSPKAGLIRWAISGDSDTFLSRLESEFARVIKDAGLPRPHTNRPAGSFCVDCRWPDHGLTVELDSYGFHNSRRSWKKDHQRDREARARGDEFRRYIWDDVFLDPVTMLTELTQLLDSPA